MKTVSVKFALGYGQAKSYAYLTDIEDIKAGDTVVVDSPNSGYTCVAVVGVDDSVDAINKANKWIVSKVDVSGYEERLRKEQEKAKLVAKLQKLKSEILERNQFEELAKLSPDAAELVNQLKALY